MAYINGERAEYTAIVEDFLKNSEEFPEAEYIARRNSEGRIWLIGGYIYGNIVKEKYGVRKEKPLIDIDILMENTRKDKDAYIPPGWAIRFSEHYGNSYLLREDGKVRIDLNYLKSFHPIIARKLRPRLRHFFTTTPLDIQSISCDITSKPLLISGWRSIEAIKRKVVRINNLEEANYVAKNIMGITIEDLVKSKAEELGFGYNISPMVTENYKKTIERLGRLMDSEESKKLS